MAPIYPAVADGIITSAALLLERISDPIDIARTQSTINLAWQLAHTEAK